LHSAITLDRGLCARTTRRPVNRKRFPQTGENVGTAGRDGRSHDDCGTGPSEVLKKIGLILAKCSLNRNKLLVIAERSRTEVARGSVGRKEKSRSTMLQRRSIPADTRRAVNHPTRFNGRDQIFVLTDQNFRRPIRYTGNKTAVAFVMVLVR